MCFRYDGLSLDPISGLMSSTLFQPGIYWVTAPCGLVSPWAFVWLMTGVGANRISRQTRLVVVVSHLREGHWKR
jgi:hypothetical protein